MRKLGFIETFCHLYHTHYARTGMILTRTSVTGPLTSTLLNLGLQRITQRHPLLRATIVATPDAECQFIIHQHIAIPLQTVTANMQQWSIHYDRLIQEDFATDAHCLWRLVFLRAPQGAQHLLLATFHHAIADAKSCLTFTIELLDECARLHANQPMLDVATSLLPVAAEQLLQSTAKTTTVNADLQNATFHPYEHSAPILQRSTRPLFFALDVAQTAALTVCCRNHSVSVNSALSAALVMAVYSGSDTLCHTPFTTTLDLRPFCRTQIDRRQIGCYVTSLLNLFSLPPIVSFWRFAQMCETVIKQDIATNAATLSSVPLDAKTALAQLCALNDLIEQHQLFLNGPMLSNLGRSQAAKNYGAFTLDDWDFSTNSIAGNLLCTVNVITLFERMQCCLTYTEPLLSQQTAQRLLDAFATRILTALKEH